MDIDVEKVTMFYKEVFASLKDHCNKRECKNCAFISTFAVCSLERKPYQYNLEQIENAVLMTLLEELEQERRDKNV